MDQDLFRAILSMDAYHRGYNSGLTTNGLGKIIESNIIGNQIGAATVSHVATNEAAQDIGFYGAAYSWNGETVISFRGTDDIDTSNWLDQAWDTVTGLDANQAGFTRTIKSAA